MLLLSGCIFFSLCAIRCHTHSNLIRFEKAKKKHTIHSIHSRSLAPHDSLRLVLAPLFHNFVTIDLSKFFNISIYYYTIFIIKSIFEPFFIIHFIRIFHSFVSSFFFSCFVFLVYVPHGPRVRSKWLLFLLAPSSLYISYLFAPLIFVFIQPYDTRIYTMHTHTHITDYSQAEFFRTFFFLSF